MIALFRPLTSPDREPAPAEAEVAAPPADHVTPAEVPEPAKEIA